MHKKAGHNTVEPLRKTGTCVNSLQNSTYIITVSTKLSSVVISWSRKLLSSPEISQEQKLGI